MKRAGTGIDGTLSSRYECKYFLPEWMVGEVRSFLRSFARPDAYAARRPDLRYAISSLYLDTPDLRLYRQTAEGAKNRFKLRIRTYSDDPGAPVFFEIKRRTNGVIRKARSSLDRRRSLAYLESRERLSPRAPGAFAPDFEEFARLAHSSEARPAMRVKYWREAYESTGSDPVRVTFDTRLRYAVTTGPHVSHNGPGWRETPVEGVILELKFTDVFPSWVRLLIDRFELQRRSIAKYARSMEHALGTGACSPALFRDRAVGRRVAD